MYIYRLFLWCACGLCQIGSCPIMSCALYLLLYFTRTCFERAKYSPYFLSFLLSAVWHGFYPGYYLCFLYLGVANESAKKVR